MRVLKWVRRTHLYTGLVLLPWVIFFGFSGMLFNHPNFGPEEQVGGWSPAETRSQGLALPDAGALADTLVAALNESAGEGSLRRVPGEAAAFEGAFVLQGETEGGGLTFVLDPSEGDARAVRTAKPARTAPPAFLSATPPTPESLKGESLQSLAGGLLTEAGIATQGPLQPSPRGGAELRLRVESPETGQRWNVAWNLQSGSLSARESDSGGPDLYTALTRFHKTHHYPEQVGARWFWSAFADATGLTMVFWGVSGAIMWWQLKPTRFLGVTGLSVAAVLALLVFTGTFRNLHWVPREARPAPGASPRNSSPERPGPRTGAAASALPSAGTAPSEPAARATP